MNIKKIRIHNFANLFLFMNNVTYLYFEKSNFEKYSISDIKSLFMGRGYTFELLKLSYKPSINISNLDIINKMSNFELPIDSIFYNLKLYKIFTIPLVIFVYNRFFYNISIFIILFYIFLVDATV